MELQLSAITVPLRRAASAVFVIMLSGCSALDALQLERESPAVAADMSRYEDATWNSAQPESILQEGKSSVVLLTPFSVPAEVADTQISMELTAGSSIRDVVAILGRLGYPLIVADDEVEKKTFFLPHYTGKVGGLLSALARATDVWFTWHDGTIIVSRTERIGISIPQEEGFAEKLAAGLEAQGLKGHIANRHAGMVVGDLTPSSYRKMRAFLERQTANAAIVNLQVAVVAVRHTGPVLRRSSEPGGPAKEAAPSVLERVKSAFGSMSAGQYRLSDPTAVPSEPLVPQMARTLNAAAVTGSSLTGAVFNERFSFVELHRFLQGYGETETEQNVILKTVAGNKVEFRSLTQVPYVSEVGVTTSSSVSLGSTRTEKADDGLSVEMTPLYDAASGMVTIDLKLAVKAVVAFNELSAGNQIGRLTQPTTADRSFTDTLRLQPGQTVVVGGLTYDSVTGNRGEPVFMQGTRQELQSLQVSRQTMFLVVRPTIVKLGHLDQREAGEELIELMPVEDGFAEEN